MPNHATAQGYFLPLLKYDQKKIINGQANKSNRKKIRKKKDEEIKRESRNKWTVRKFFKMKNVRKCNTTNSWNTIKKIYAQNR
jgi:hypothetical protein